MGHTCIAHRDNELGEEGAKAVVVELKHLVKLKHLDLG